jgi:hypothetical protein
MSSGNKQTGFSSPQLLMPAATTVATGATSPVIGNFVYLNGLLGGTDLEHVQRATNSLCTFSSPHNYSSEASASDHQAWCSGDSI